MAITFCVTQRVEISTPRGFNSCRNNAGARLVGARLVLREFDETDEGAVHSYASDSVVTEFMDWGPNSVVATRSLLREAMTRARTSARSNFDLAVVDIESQALIGGTGLSVTNVEHR